MHSPTEYKSHIAGCILNTIYYQYKKIICSEINIPQQFKKYHEIK